MQRFLATTALFLALGASPALAAEQATAEFLDAEGKSIGTATLVEGPQGVLIRIQLEGLAPGWHAIHIHSVGTCEDHGDGFKASSGHLNPDDKEHGLMNAKGPDAGDLPNFYADDAGRSQAEFFTLAVSLPGAEGRATVLDEDGAALVIHEGPDDHETQPIGGAGSRVACGVVTTAE